MRKSLAFVLLAAAVAAYPQSQASGAWTWTGTAGPTSLLCGPPGYLCSRTDTAVIPYPSVPPQAGANTCTAGNLRACGNLNGAGTVMTDTRYSSNQTARCTDASTPSNQAANGFFASLGGSGDALEMSIDDNYIRIADNSRGIMKNFNPSTMACSYMACGVATGGYCAGSAGFTPQSGVFSALTAGVYYSFGDNTTYNVQIQKWVLSSSGPTSKTLVADMAQALPFAHDAAVDWSSGTVTAGAYIHPTVNNAGGYYYQAIQGGTTGGSAPVFPQTMPSGPTCNGTQILPSVSDGGVVWMLVGGNSPGWFDPAGVNNTDTVFQAGIGTFCGQGGGIWAVSYDASANTYYLFNTATGFQTHWTCGGGGTGPDCTAGAYSETIDGQPQSAANGFYIHNDKSGKDGAWETVSYQRSTVSGSNGTARFWSPSAATVTLMTAAGDCAFGGHWSTRFTDIINQNNTADGVFWKRSMSSPNTCTGLWVPASPSLNTDGHWSTNYGTTAQNSAVIGSTSAGGSTYPPIGDVFEAEVIGFSTDGSNTQWRFGQVLNSYASNGFDPANAIGSLSADGQFFAFTSDWLCTLGAGLSTTTANCGFFWEASTSYAAGTMICPAGGNHNSGRNSGYYCFTAGGACTSGSTEPSPWNQTVSGTTSEGTCTWTNAGAYNARADVFIMKLQ